MEGQHLDKIVGVPDEHMADAEAYTKRVADHIGTKKREHEIEKTQHDIELLNFAQSAVDEYLQKYGREQKIVLPLERIHILKEGGVGMTSSKVGGGSHSTYGSSVDLDRSPSDITFTLRAFHELVHAKSYQALQATSTRDEKTGQPHIVPFRSGLSVVTRDGEKVYFRSLNEAVVATLERRFYDEKVKGNPLFANDQGEPELSRERELETLTEFVDDLWEKNKTSFRDRNEILDLFIEAGVTGKLLKVARLIEKTYGRGSVRKGAEKDVYYPHTQS